MIRYIDTHKNRFGVENICTILNKNLAGGVTTSRGYRAAKARIPAARTLKDQVLIPELERIHQENYGVYVARSPPRSLEYRPGPGLPADENSRYRWDTPGL